MYYFRVAKFSRISHKNMRINIRVFFILFSLSLITASIKMILALYPKSLPTAIFYYSPEQAQGHARLLAEQESRRIQVFHRQKGHKEGLQPPHYSLQMEAQDAILERSADTSSARSIAYHLSMTMLSTDCNRKDAVFCLMIYNRYGK